ncbi:hypothetical protein LJR074_002211 [Acidovorax sp. LjRoot74]|uniref:hypothetical protein n=1 Tax=Acidovorax sp. LjRoot74 TaxID=3342337 RepID=UPI003ECE5BCB
MAERKPLASVGGGIVEMPAIDTLPVANIPAVVAAQTNAATSKATPATTDEIPLADSAASFGLKKLTWTNLRATVLAWIITQANAWTGLQTFRDLRETIVTANTSTAYTINLANGTLFSLTLTGNCTFTFPTATSGKQFTVLLKQDGTGSRTVAWPSSVRWVGGTEPTVTATAGQTDVISFIADGTYWLAFVAGQNYTRS